MPSINCKAYLELNWIEDCIFSSPGDSLTDAKLHVPIVTLSTKDSTILIKQLSKGFKNSVYCNSYETKPAKVIEQGKNLFELLNALYQGVKRLFVFDYAIAANGNDEAVIKSNKMYFWLMEGISMINQLMAW